MQLFCIEISEYIKYKRLYKYVAANSKKKKENEKLNH